MSLLSGLPAHAKISGRMPETRRPAIAAWIAETEAERARYEVGLRTVPAAPRQRMTEAEIRSIVDKLADIARVLRDADPNDKSEIFRQLAPKLTYHPGRRLMQAQVMPAEYRFFECIQGQGLPIAHASDIALTTALVLGAQ